MRDTTTRDRVKVHADTATTSRASRVPLWVPLAFVLVPLVALAILPFASEWLIRPLSEDMQRVAEPGRGLVSRIQLSLALEGSVLHDYSRTPSEELAALYHSAEAVEDSAYAQLAPLIERLGPNVQRHFAELQRIEDQWHAGAVAFLADPEGQRTPVDPLDLDLYRDLIVTAARLDESIEQAAGIRRERIQRAEVFVRWTTLVLGALAVGGVVVVAWLGSRLRLYANESHARRVELERAIESRARLIRGLSHDLKNPLGAIDGHAMMLADGIYGPLAGAQAESVGHIRRMVRTLLRLIDDLLELSRVEAGQLAITPRETDLALLVREIAAEHAAAAEASGHRFDVEPNGAVPPVRTDPDRVRQIVGNLISNAVKYTPAGGRVVVHSTVRGDGHGRRWAVIEVRDSGPGIPVDKRETIFDEFSRLEPSSAPGAGLGLAIARRLARLLGGNVTIENATEGGSAFLLWLPVAPPDGTLARRPAPSRSTSEAA